MTKLRAKVWLEKDGRPVLGSGRAELLQTIDAEGSINKAAKKLGMSYRHAWGIIKKINRAWCKEVVRSTRGGKEGGRTTLTESGRALLKEYHEKAAALDRLLK